jgi:multidrug resistance protein
VSQASSSAADAAITISNDGVRSVYEFHSKRRQYLILLAAAIASIMVPFTDTIYLPALQAVGQDLSASADLVAASVAIYMLTVGVGSLIWGPAADKYGRRIAYAASTVLFLGTTVACIFAPSIAVLVAFRALQGLAVASFSTTGQGVVADVFPPHMRGTAAGLFMIPLLVGPLLGPLLGGVLSQVWGWRSTFICLVVFCGGVVAPLLAVLVPETHQYMVVKRLSKRDPTAAKQLVEAEVILSRRPTFAAPWVPLKYLIERDIAPYALLTMSSFGVMFASLTEWPAKMSQPPYSLSQAIIGVSYLAMGVAGFVGSPLGGKASDITAAKWSQVPQARLLANIAAALVLMPAGLLLYGWTLHHNTHIVGPLVGHFVIGVASSAYLPGMFGYISTIKQQNASAAAAAVQASMFIIAAVLIYASVAGVQSLGFGWYFTLLAFIQLVLAIIAALCLWRSFRKVYETAQSRQHQQHQASTSPGSAIKLASSRAQLLSAEDGREAARDVATVV